MVLKSIRMPERLPQFTPHRIFFKEPFIHGYEKPKDQIFQTAHQVQQQKILFTHAANSNQEEL